jgi:hypothetical protein
MEGWVMSGSRRSISGFTAHYEAKSTSGAEPSKRLGWYWPLIVTLEKTAMELCDFERTAVCFVIARKC